MDTITSSDGGSKTKTISSASCSAMDALAAAANESTPAPTKGSTNAGTSTSSTTGAEPDHAPESSSATQAAPVAAEPTYSTRGRHKESSNEQDNLSAILEDEATAKDTSGGGGGTSGGAGAGGSSGGSGGGGLSTTSFLEALSEEERRTRTRFLPEVDGMHSLMRNEVKSDLLLARNLGGSPSTGGSRKRQKRDDGGSTPTPGDEEVSSSAAASSARNVIEGLAIPSKAFAAFDTDKTEQQPWKVESCSAYNPPRPPESVGPKKKHRMARWERRPQDVESDLRSYRQTVEKTREELHAADAERERMETVGAHLRSHFLAHLEALNEEGKAIQAAMSSAQQDCVRAADLLTSSRTRSSRGGMGKASSYVMRDVISILKGRGIDAGPPDAAASQVVTPDVAATKGIGGISAGSFGDWDRASCDFPASSIATSWILPGETVETPYGTGKALDVFGPTPLSAIEVPPEDSQDDGGGAMDVDTKENGEKKRKSKMKTRAEGSYDPNTVLAPRIRVKLSFGAVGYFSPKAVQSMEDPSRYSDAQLANRWKSLVNTALSAGAALDLDAMETLGVNHEEQDMNGGPTANGEEDMMDVDEHNQRTSDASKPTEEENIRLLPFGSGMLPTSNGRGMFLAGMSMSDLEQGLHKAIFGGAGNLGRRANQGVTTDYREWEDTREDLGRAKARVLHLKNQLNRQRRIRINNEKTLLSCRERGTRVERLVSEMRTDLKSLKDRLEDEIVGLGIDCDMSDGLLEEYYRATYENGKSDYSNVASPPRRYRKVTKEAAVKVSPKQTRRRAAANAEEHQQNQAASNEQSRNKAGDGNKSVDTGMESSEYDVGAGASGEPAKKRMRQETVAAYD